MPRWTRGPFPNLAALSPVDVNTADPLDVLERCDLINAVLADAGCNCNGHARGQQRDPYFGADLSELVARCTPHEVNSRGVDGTVETHTVHVRIESLQVEVDDNGELCVWIYEEY